MPRATHLFTIAAEQSESSPPNACVHHGDVSGHNTSVNLKTALPFGWAHCCQAVRTRAPIALRIPADVHARAPHRARHQPPVPMQIQHLFSLFPAFPTHLAFMYNFAHHDTSHTRPRGALHQQGPARHGGHFSLLWHHEGIAQSAQAILGIACNMVVPARSRAMNISPKLPHLTESPRSPVRSTPYCYAPAP